MNKLTFEIHADIHAQFQHLRAGGFLVCNLRAAAERLRDIDIDAMFALSRSQLVQAEITVQNIAMHPSISAWRSTIQSCGLSPSMFKSSPEQLARRVLKDGSVKTPLPIVSAYCAISACWIAPIGGYDIARLPSESIMLRFVRSAQDSFEPLGARAEDMPLKATVPVYAIGETVMCYAFNVRDSRKTCLTPETDTAVFFAEAATEVQREPMMSALSDLREYLSRHGASVGRTQIANKATPTIVLGP